MPSHLPGDRRGTADAADQARAEPLSQAAGHLGRATAHYSQALTPVVTLSKSGAQPALQKQLDDVRFSLIVRRAGALLALSEARSCLARSCPAGEHPVPAPPPSTQRPARLR